MNILWVFLRVVAFGEQNVVGMEKLFLIFLVRIHLIPLLLGLVIYGYHCSLIVDIAYPVVLELILDLLLLAGDRDKFVILFDSSSHIFLYEPLRSIVEIYDVALCVILLGFLSGDMCHSFFQTFIHIIVDVAAAVASHILCFPLLRIWQLELICAPAITCVNNLKRFLPNNYYKSLIIAKTDAADMKMFLNFNSAIAFDGFRFVIHIDKSFSSGCFCFILKSCPVAQEFRMIE